MFHWRWIAAPLWLAACCLVGPGDARAQEFRMETDVYVQGREEPISENLTLFSQGLVYDFPLSGGANDVTMLDVQGQRVLLFDTERKVRTELSTEQLIEISRLIKQLGERQDAGALFDPELESSFDPDTKALTLTSREVTYRVMGEAPKAPAAALRYREFADWFSRLTAARPGNPPPFARLELNRLLAEKELLPAEIERTLVMGRGLAAKKHVATSKHSIYWQLTNTDRARIETVTRYLGSNDFKNVSFVEYLNLSRVAAR